MPLPVEKSGTCYDGVWAALGAEGYPNATARLSTAINIAGRLEVISCNKSCQLLAFAHIRIFAASCEPLMVLAAGEFSSAAYPGTL